MTANQTFADSPPHRVLEETVAWTSRPLESVYAAVFLLIQGGLDHCLGQCLQQSARPGQGDALGAGLPDQLSGCGQLLR
jgi:hypothetical protein